MPILPILEAPDPRLKEVSQPVEKVDATVQTLMRDMLETMYTVPGVGLAAIQVGVPQQVIVMDLSEDDQPPAPRFFVNPEIIWSSEELSNYREGCLSVPDVYADLKRPASVRIRYLDFDGTMCEELAEGLFATCIQHEMDHLKGILFIDHFSPLQRAYFLEKLEKARKKRDRKKQKANAS